MSDSSYDSGNSETPWQIISYPRLPSTMDEAWSLFREKEHEGIVVYTQDQYQGRGRNGKTWIGKPGQSLAFSITLLPDIGTLLFLAPAFSLALVNCFSKVQQSDVKVKWPNDILINAKKVAGILMETVIQDNTVRMVLGVGINLTLDTDEFEEIQNQATNLQDHTVIEIDPDVLLGMVVLELQRIYSLVQNGWSPVPDWKLYLTTIGQWVKIGDKSSTLEGRVVDVDDRGRLLIQDEGGYITAISSGELI